MDSSKRTVIKCGIAAAAISLLWIFMGFERIVGDHEMNVSWEPFIKHRASLQIRFENPAQRGLEIMPEEDLSPAERSSFIDFCAIRFGTTNVKECRSRIAERKS